MVNLPSSSTNSYPKSGLSVVMFVFDFFRYRFEKEINPIPAITKAYARWVKSYFYRFIARRAKKQKPNGILKLEILKPFILPKFICLPAPTLLRRGFLFDRFYRVETPLSYNSTSITRL